MDFIQKSKKIVVMLCTLLVILSLHSQAFEDCRCTEACTFDLKSGLPAEEVLEEIDGTCDVSVNTCASREDAVTSLILSDGGITAGLTAVVVCPPKMATISPLDDKQDALLPFEYLSKINQNSGYRSTSLDVFTYRTINSSMPSDAGKIHLASIDILPVNDLPVVDEETGYPNVNVTTDETFAQGLGLHGVLHGSDVYDDPDLQNQHLLTFSIVIPPANGFACTATTSTDLLTETAASICRNEAWDTAQPGQFLYVPNPGFIGSDEFRYEVSDRPAQELNQDKTYKTQCGKALIEVGSSVSTNLPSVKDVQVEGEVGTEPLIGKFDRTFSNAYTIKFDVVQDCGGEEYCQRGSVEVLCGGTEVANWEDCDAEGASAGSARYGWFRYTPHPHCNGTDSFKYMLYGKMSDDIWVPGQNEAEVTLVNAFIPTAPVVVELLSIEAPMSPEGELVIDSSFNLTSSTTQLSVTAYDWDSYDCLADAPRANAGNLTIMLNTSQIQGTLLDASAQKVQYNYSVPDNPPNGSDLQLYYVAPALRRGVGLDILTYQAVDPEGHVSQVGTVAINVVCAPGYRIDGIDGCAGCKEGMYSLQADSLVCTPCSLGHSNPSLALSSNCPACLADEYQDEIGQAHCKKCPAGSDSSLSTLRSKRSDCICKPLHHGTPGSECPPCPKPIIEFVHDSENMTAAMDPWSRCDTYDQRWPLPLAGYWLNVQRDKAGVVQVRQCVKPESCLEMKLNKSESENEEIMHRISKGWTCATGYTGEACAMCCEGDEEDPSCPGAYYRLNGVCMVCPEGDSGFMIGAMIVIGLFAPAIFAVTDKMPALPSLDIGLTFAQVTATFPGRDLNWPASVKRVMDACSVFSFNVEMVHPECSLKEWGFIYKWRIFMLLPVFLLLAIICRILFNRWYMAHAAKVKWLVETKAPVLLAAPPGADAKWHVRLRGQTRYKFMVGITQTLSPKQFNEFSRGQLRIFLTVCHLGYVFLSTNAAQFFDCVKDNASGKDGGAVKWFLQADPAIQCFVFDDPDNVWTQYFPWAVIAILAYPVGILVLFATMLFKIRYDLDHAASRNSVGFFYAKFRPQWFWFGILLMLRNVTIVLTELLFSDDNSKEDDEGNENMSGQQYVSLWQSLMALAVLLVMMIFQFHAQPFNNKKLDQLEGMSVAVQGFTIFGGLIFLSDTGEKSTLSDTFKEVLAMTMIALLLFTYTIMGLKILTDIYPDYSKDVIKSYESLRTKKTPEEKRLAKEEKEMTKAKKKKEKEKAKKRKEGLEVPSVLSSMAARKFADKLMVSKVGNLVFTLKGRSLALHEMKTNGAALHKQRMLKFKAMYDFFNVENDNIWIQRREPHTMEKILQKKKMLDLIRLMANRSREDNMKLVHMAEDVLKWKEGEDNEKEQSKRHVKLMNTLSQGNQQIGNNLLQSMSYVKENAKSVIHRSLSNVNHGFDDHSPNPAGNDIGKYPHSDGREGDGDQHVEESASTLTSPEQVLLTEPTMPCEAHVSLDATAI